MTEKAIIVRALFDSLGLARLDTTQAIHVLLDNSLAICVSYKTHKTVKQLIYVDVIYISKKHNVAIKTNLNLKTDDFNVALGLIEVLRLIDTSKFEPLEIHEYLMEEILKED